MGKTKTFIVEGIAEDKKSGKEAYEAKMLKRAQTAAVLSGSKMVSTTEPVEGAKRAASQAAQPPQSSEPHKSKNKAQKPDKGQVKGLGLKGGERIKVIGAEISDDTSVTGTETSVQSDIVESKKQKKLKVRSKNYKAAYAKVSKDRFYKLPETLKLLRDIKYSKFDETVELHITTKTSPMNVNVTLPHSTGKQKVVEIATDKTIEKLKGGKVDFDVLVATADMMPKLVPFARLLGPKGLMPNPKNGTLIKNVKDANKFGGNAVNLRTQKDANAIHTVSGKLSLGDKELMENTKAIIDAVGDKQIVKVFIKTTMSPSVKVQV